MRLASALAVQSAIKKVIVNLNGVEIQVERIGTDGNVEKARQMYLDLDGKVDAFGVGGVDLYLRIDQKEYPLHAALRLSVVSDKGTPLCDGRDSAHLSAARVSIGEVHAGRDEIQTGVRPRRY